MEKNTHRNRTHFKTINTSHKNWSITISLPYALTHAFRQTATQRTKKNIYIFSFPNMVSPMTSSPADRLSFSSFNNMVSYRQHLRYFCRRKKKFFLQIIFSTKTFIFFTKLCMVCYTHTLPKTDRREKKKEKNFFFPYIFFLLTFPFPLQ